jgi:3-deoxy-D-manno-octulosonic-acid transferase
MRLFYSVFIDFYGFLIKFAGYFYKKASDWLTVRQNWEIDLKQKIAPNVKYVWIHCASAGEFEQAIPLTDRIKSQESRVKTTKIAVSFFSSSGFEMYKDSDLADLFFYFPLDTTTNAKQLIELLNPTFAIFIRNEIWLNILSELKNKKIPTFLVNANLQQKRSFFYQYFLNKTYPLFTKVFDTKTFGNTKLERVVENKNAVFNDAILADFCKDSFVIILGSSWREEEKYIADFYEKNYGKIKRFKLIIAPHEFGNYIESGWSQKTINNHLTFQRDNFKKLNHSDLKSLLLFVKKEYKPLFSLLQKTGSSEYSKYKFNQNSNILFLDKKGVLKYAYRYADIAVIGGGFGKSVHNVAEAAVYGIPTIFGTNFYKFEEVNELVNLQLAFPVKDYENFEKTMLELIENNALRTNIKEDLITYFSAQENVSKNILAEIDKAIL